MWVAESSCSLSVYRIKYQNLLNIGGPEQLNRYSDLLRSGRSGRRIPAGARFSTPLQDRPKPPIECVLVLFPGGKAAGARR